MTVTSSRVGSFALGAAAPGSVTAVFGVVTGAAAGTALATGADIATCVCAVGAYMAAGIGLATASDFEVRPSSMVAGALVSGVAIGWAGWYFSYPAPALPPQPQAAAPATTLVVEGACKNVQTQVMGKDGQRLEITLPPGCALKPR